MKIFPHLLARIGGESFNSLEQLGAPDIAQWHGDFRERKANYRLIKEKFSADLLELIQECNDQGHQKRLQNFRRDIFNDRNPKREELALARAIMPVSLQESFSSLNEFRNSLDILMKEGKTIYDEADLQYRIDIQLLTNKETLTKGLVLSSQALFNARQKFSVKNPESFSKEDLHIEQSLLKYFTRMTAKTSPFSTFANLTTGRLVFNEGSLMAGGLMPIDADRDSTSHLRLNNRLLEYLKDVLVVNKAVIRHLNIRPNPTIELRDDHYLFLTNNNNVESFQRISASPLLHYLLEVLGKHSTLIYDILISECLTETDASTEDLQDFVDQLIEYGFLEVDFGVSGIDADWDISLSKSLKPATELPYIEELVETLAKIRSYAREYEILNALDRKRIINDAHSLFKQTCTRLHEAAGLPEDERKEPAEVRKEFAKGPNGQTTDKKEVTDDEAFNDNSKKDEEGDVIFKHNAVTRFLFRPEQIFYEDTTRNVSIGIDALALKELIEDLNQLIRGLAPLSQNLVERSKMADYFVHKYGQTSTVSLLTFYEDFYRDVKKSENEKASKRRMGDLKEAKEADRNVVDSDAMPHYEPKLTNRLLAEQRRRRQHLRDFISKKVSKFPQDEIDFDDELLIDFRDKETVTENCFGAFLQPFASKDTGGHPILKAVVNGIFPGYGKMFSRFLHIIDGTVSEDLKIRNAQASKEMLFVENTDASYFNANLHPPLMPFEIRIPGGHNSLDSQQQLPVSDFVVSFNETQESLNLIHTPTGKRAFVFDLGFQGQGGRSQLYQLLDHFSKAEYTSIFPLTSMITELLRKSAPDSNDEGIAVLPRITFKGKLTIQRKRWIIPRKLLPEKRSSESNFEFHLRILEWKMKIGLPDDIFVFVYQKSFGPNKNKKAGRDDYKPQYINFQNTGLVILFGKLIGKVEDEFRIEEMLPGPEHLMTLGDQKYVTEFVVEWSK